MKTGDKDWDNGHALAHLEVRTEGPERYWELEMRSCEQDGVKYIVVLDPFGERLMWFDADKPGMVEAQMAFTHLVGVAMCDVAIPSKGKEEAK